MSHIVTLEKYMNELSVDRDYHIIHIYIYDEMKPLLDEMYRLSDTLF